MTGIDVAYHHGLCLSELGRPEEAVAVLERALELDSTHTHAGIALGVAFARLDQYDEAARVLTGVVQATPDDPLAKRNLAAVLMRGGKAQEALPYFRQAASLAPADRVAGGLRMDAVMYMQSAIERFARMDPAEVGRITMEIAMLGREGLELNNPSVRYTLKATSPRSNCSRTCTWACAASTRRPTPAPGSTASTRPP